MHPPETKAILTALKTVLRSKKIRYKEIAKQLDVSEPTVKRIFSGDEVTLSRLCRICEIADVTLGEISAMTASASDRTFLLSEAQEKALAEDPALYHFWTLLRLGKSPNDLAREYTVKQSKIFKWLRGLEKLKLIELYPNNRISILTSGTHTWIKRGPLQRRLMRQRHAEYLDSLESQLGQDGHFLTSSERFVTKATLDDMIRDLDFFAQRFRDRAFREEKLYRREDLIPVQWILGAGHFQRDFAQLFS